jgi:predicted phosphodiesterase
MSGLTWLHLSDWHQRGEDFDREIVRDALLADVENRRRISSDLGSVDLIIFTGDLTFSGKSEEFDAAYNYLLKPLFKSLGLTEAEGKDRLCIVPGNHDLDRSVLQTLDLSASVRGPRDIHEILSTEGKRKALFSPFAAYRNFISKQFAGSMGDEPEYSYVRKFDIDGRKVGIVGLNSAWYSGRTQSPSGEISDYGNLIVGEKQVYPALNSLRDTDISIAVMHHPFPWLLDFDRDVVEERLCNQCHFVLHGHQHQPRVQISTTTLGEVVVIPGGATYDRRRSDDPRYTNAYNFTHVDFKTERGSTYLRRWSDQPGKWVEDSQLHRSGYFTFEIPKGTHDWSDDRKAARQKVVSRFMPALTRRFCEEIDLSIKHHLEKHGEIELVRHEVRYQIRVAEGLPDRFGISTEADCQVVQLAEAGNTNVTPLVVHHFRVNGAACQPAQKTSNTVLYSLDLPNTNTHIDYKYTLYLRPDGVYLFNMTRFTHGFKLRFQRDSQLAYDFTPIGGFPQTVPQRNEMFEIDEMQVSDLCHPDQGYLIQWFRPGGGHRQHSPE